MASTAATFATPGVNIGAFCATPGVALGRAVGRKHALEMLLTGDAVSAARAHEIGLVNRVVPPEALDAEVESLARLIASKSSTAIASGKQVFSRQLELPLREAYGLAGHAIACDFFSDDGKEGVDAFLGKRAPQWKGSSERSQSPRRVAARARPTLGRPPRTTSARVVDPSRFGSMTKTARLFAP